MADVVVTMRILPESPKTSLKDIEVKARQEIEKFAGNPDFKVSIKPLAFGLSSLEIIFMMDESKGSTERLEDSIKSINEVSSVEVTDVRRAVG